MDFLLTLRSDLMLLKVPHFTLEFLYDLILFIKHLDQHLHIHLQMWRILSGVLLSLISGLDFCLRLEWYTVRTSLPHGSGSQSQAWSRTRAFPFGVLSKTFLRFIPYRYLMRKQRRLEMVMAHLVGHYQMGQLLNYIFLYTRLLG